MHWLKVSSLLALLAVPSFAAGFQYVPKWHLVEMPSGLTEACYSYEDAKTLAMLDNELIAFAGLKADLPKLKKAHADQVLSLYEQIKLLEYTSVVLEKHRDTLLNELRESEKKRIVAENSVSGAVGWVVAGGVALLAAGVVAGVLLTNPSGR